MPPPPFAAESLSLSLSLPLPPPLSTFPRTPLLLPTPSPIELLPSLTEKLQTATPDFTARLFIKREDLNSSLAGFGGNKVRKLEFILGDALALLRARREGDWENGQEGNREGERRELTIITTGGVQSNHMRQVAAACAKLHLRCILIPVDMVEAQRGVPEYYAAGNVQLTSLLGAEVLDPREGRSVDDVVRMVEEEGGLAYPIPAGGSTHELGGLGYVRWCFEVVRQEAEMGVVFDTIVLAVASGSTLAGIVVGMKLIEKLRREKGEDVVRRRIIGIDAYDKDAGEIRKVVMGIARTTAVKVGLGEDDVKDEDFEVDDRFTAGAYGKLDDATAEGIREWVRSESVLLDPVYTGKAATGLLAKAREGAFSGSKNILFVHTGGQMSLSSYPQLK